MYKSDTYNVPVGGDLIETTHRPIGGLKQELDEPDDEA